MVRLSMRMKLAFLHPVLIAQYGDCRKIACTISLDDTQLGLIGWLLRHLC